MEAQTTLWDLPRLTKEKLVIVASFNRVIIISHTSEQGTVPTAKAQVKPLVYVSLDSVVPLACYFP
jgi:hypothetical protein